MPHICNVVDAMSCNIVETLPNKPHLATCGRKADFLILFKMNFKNYENAIFQISGADLKDFAEMLIASAQSELKQAKEETYLSREKVSEMLEVDKSTLWRWEKTGFLIPVHIGAKVRYRRSDIDKLLKVEEGEA